MHRNYQAPEALLKDKVILVTGASDGIGRVAAMTYARYGATLILHGRNAEKLENVANEIEAQTAVKPEIVVLDLMTANETDYHRLKDVIMQRFDRLDGILHNAGILGHRVALLDYPIATFDEVMKVNVREPLLLTQILLPVLQQSQNASVIFTSSGVGRSVREQWGAYSLSKIVIEAISQLCALENTSSIRFNCINPGATRTAMRAAAFPDENPLQLATAEQIMATYLYLIGDDSLSICGKSLDAQVK